MGSKKQRVLFYDEMCVYHVPDDEIPPPKAEGFCGAWIQSEDRACGTPLCRKCAEIRGNIWLCLAHRPGGVHG